MGTWTIAALPGRTVGVAAVGVLGLMVAGCSSDSMDQDRTLTPAAQARSTAPRPPEGTDDTPLAK